MTTEENPSTPKEKLKLILDDIERVVPYVLATLQVSDVVVARAVSYTLEELQKRGLFTTVAQAAMTEHQMEIVDIVKFKCRELALKQVIHRFGIRVGPVNTAGRTPG